MATVPGWALAVVDLWLRCRRAGAGGLAPVPVLPGAGGMGDQPAALMDAFDWLDRRLAAEQAAQQEVT